MNNNACTCLIAANFPISDCITALKPICLATLVDTLDIFKVWKESYITREYPVYPPGKGFYERVGSGRERMPYNTGRVGNGNTIYTNGLGWEREFPNPCTALPQC